MQASKSFVVHTGRNTVEQFNDIDLAERHCRLHGGGSIYLRGQVSNIPESGGLCLYAHDTQPLRRI